MPGLQRLEYALIVVQADIVRDQAVVIDYCSIGHSVLPCHCEERSDEAISIPSEAPKRGCACRIS
jgi:hypothetical protein